VHLDHEARDLTLCLHCGQPNDNRPYDWCQACTALGARAAGRALWRNILRERASLVDYSAVLRIFG